MDEDDRSRFERLYRAHVDAVFAYARSRATSERAAEVVEETFLVAWRRLHELPAEPRAWLIGVARRSLANAWRSDRRREALDVRMLAERAGNLAAYADPADEVIAREQSLGALRSLPESDRELIALVAWGELLPSAAAAVLGCSKATFLVRLHRARRRYQAALAEADAEPPPAFGSVTRPRFAKETL